MNNIKEIDFKFQEDTLFSFMDTLIGLTNLKNPSLNNFIKEELVPELLNRGREYEKNFAYELMFDDINPENQEHKSPSDSKYSSVLTKESIIQAYQVAIGVNNEKALGLIDQLESLGNKPSPIDAIEIIIKLANLIEKSMSSQEVKEIHYGYDGISRYLEPLLLEMGKDNAHHLCKEVNKLIDKLTEKDKDKFFKALNSTDDNIFIASQKTKFLNNQEKKGSIHEDSIKEVIAYANFTTSGAGTFFIDGVDEPVNISFTEILDYYDNNLDRIAKEAGLKFLLWLVHLGQEQKATSHEAKLIFEYLKDELILISNRVEGYETTPLYSSVKELQDAKPKNCSVNNYATKLFKSLREELQNVLISKTDLNSKSLNVLLIRCLNH